MYVQCGRNYSEGARRMNLNRVSFQHRVKEAARRGIAPGHFEHGTAPGFHLGKSTIQRGPDGTIERTWERQYPDKEQLLEALRAVVEAMRDDIKPAKEVPLSRASRAAAMPHLLTLYTFTDYHLGMLAWHREGGADWDIRIAEELGLAAMRALVAGAPTSNTGVVNIAGDWLHYDSLLSITPTNGHILDADSRFGRIVDVAIRMIQHLVAEALSKHPNVILIVQEGNHDIASSVWLRKLFATLYRRQRRIKVHDEELPYYALEWGKVLLGFHHGHLSKNQSLPALFSTQFREMWGRCPKVYIHTGHRHHLEVKDHVGARVHQHPTLAARDAYAARGGWWSEREITAITYHKAYGQVASHTVTPEMLKGDEECEK